MKFANNNKSNISKEQILMQNYEEGKKIIDKL
jgi:hypothetical protein